VEDGLEIDDAGVAQLALAEELAANDRVDTVGPDENVAPFLASVCERRRDTVVVLAEAGAGPTRLHDTVAERRGERFVQVGARATDCRRAEAARERRDVALPSSMPPLVDQTNCSTISPAVRTRS
jgi:hypothetical protein